MSDLDSQINNMEIILRRVREATKVIKYDDTVQEIITAVTQLANEAGIAEKEIAYGISNVINAKNDLESEIYKLEEEFADKLRSLQWQKDDLELSEAPAQDVSYEKILSEVTDKWKGQRVQVTELSPGKEKDVAAALNKYRSGVSPEEYYTNPKVQKKVDRRAERSMKISSKHAASANVKEGGMGGINRCAPAQDVSYEKILNDVTDKWKGQTVKVK